MVHPHRLIKQVFFCVFLSSLFFSHFMWGREDPTVPKEQNAPAPTPELTLADIRVYAQEILKPVSERKFPQSIQDKRDYYEEFKREVIRYFELGTEQMKGVPDSLQWTQAAYGLQGFEINIAPTCFRKLSDNSLKDDLKKRYLEKLKWQVESAAGFIVWLASRTLGMTPPFSGVRYVNICDDESASYPWDEHYTVSSEKADGANWFKFRWKGYTTHSSRGAKDFPEDLLGATAEELVEHKVLVATEYSFKSAEAKLGVELRLWNAPTEDMIRYYERGSFVDVAKYHTLYKVATGSLLDKVKYKIGKFDESEEKINHVVWSLVKPSSPLMKFLLKKFYLYRFQLHDDSIVQSLSNSERERLFRFADTRATFADFARVYAKSVVSKLVKTPKSVTTRIVQTGQGHIGNPDENFSINFKGVKNGRLIGGSVELNIDDIPSYVEGGINIANNHNIQVDVLSFFGQSSGDIAIGDEFSKFIEENSEFKAQEYTTEIEQSGAINIAPLDHVDVSLYLTGDPINFESYRDFLMKRAGVTTALK